jgi:hypothetical protein
MKPLGIIFILLGAVLTFLGLASYASDIQLIVAFVGICMAGIGVIMIALDGIKGDLSSIHLWVKKGQEK